MQGKDCPSVHSTIGLPLLSSGEFLERNLSRFLNETILAEKLMDYYSHTESGLWSYWKYFRPLFANKKLVWRIYTHSIQSPRMGKGSIAAITRYLSSATNLDQAEQEEKKYTHPIKYLRLDNPITSLLINKWDQATAAALLIDFNKPVLVMWLCWSFTHERQSRGRHNNMGNISKSAARYGNNVLLTVFL